ncbi:MAG: PD-(D/E)XK nuclease family protein [Clostridia bacterium]|nr:PD-(D/E)XK nuclease family protein [Clostridia bacterium]
MLYRIIGAAGSGKTEEMLKRLGIALKKGRRCFVIVPEQQSVAYESMLCERFGDKVNMLCEVLNFERLPNRIAREYGGLASTNIDKGGACALLSLISEELSGSLNEYSSVAADSDFARSMYNLISRMKMAMITPQRLREDAESKLTDDEERIKAKLLDIALIYSEYEKHFDSELRDPRDALTRLANELEEKSFFANASVFIDSYYTFTEQEYAIIKQIIRQSDEVCISFTVDESRGAFEENARAAARIAALAHGNCENIPMDIPKRAKSESIRYIERNLWKSNVPEMKSFDGSIRLISASNRFDEAEAAASEILSFVRSGGRFRDITLLTASPNAYSAIVDSVFSRAEIPLYTSAKEELASKPLFSFMLASLSVVIEDFSLRSIKRYVKSGYTDLTIAESDALLSYAQAWKLRGKAWYNGLPWTLDPEGYREGDLTERGSRLLSLANTARDKIVGPLDALRESLSGELTVRDSLKAIYNHLISMGADERLRKSAQRLLEKGEREESEREIQLWKLLIDIIDQLESLCGDKKITPKRMQSLIKLMCDNYSLGAIPASADSVTFGDASLIRAGGSRLVIVLGVCDGEFPASVKTGGFFDRTEAITLEGLGLQLADTMEKQINTNRFFVYQAFAAPTERLVLTCPRSEIGGGDLRPSAAWLAVEKMIPEESREVIDFSSGDRIYSRESAAAAFPQFAESEKRDALEQVLTSARLPFFKEFPEVTQKESRIEFGEDILKLSPSKFETYAKCPFSFFGNYLLDLQEKKQNEFSMPEIGNFVHKILELFMRECVKSGKFVRPDDDTGRALVERLAESYFTEVIGVQAKDDKRFLHVYKNMVKTIAFVAESLCNEFEESDFLPVGFEFSIGLGKEDMKAIEYDVDGKRVLLRGSIDRVDIYTEKGVKYVRVVDYKTYDKSFSADLVAYGLDSQLLHYLFAYCKNSGAKPAGAFYYTVVLPNISINGRESEEEIARQIEKSIKRSGIVINNTNIVYAMSHDFSFVPVNKKDDGTLWHRGEAKRLYSDDEFTDLESLLTDKITQLSREVFCGNMDIDPLDIENVTTNPCKYCRLGDLCRNKKQEEEDTDGGDE